jgi:hypothetical protein
MGSSPADPQKCGVAIWEKERQLDGRTLHDLNKLVEQHEQRHCSQTTRDSNPEAKTADSPDARRAQTRHVSQRDLSGHRVQN